MRGFEAAGLQLGVGTAPHHRHRGHDAVAQPRGHHLLHRLDTAQFHHGLRLQAFGGKPAIDQLARVGRGFEQHQRQRRQVRRRHARLQGCEVMAADGDERVVEHRHHRQ
jgi:hypothetical protein